MWNAERYFSKANAYWLRATKVERNSEEFLLNVGFFCEFLMRGAICTRNPVLNAANDEESILFSAGVQPNRPEKTANITTIHSRIRRLIPAITTEEDNAISTLFSLRNQELHGDRNAIAKASQEEVIPGIYSFVTTVADFAKKDLHSLLGKSDAMQVRQVSEAIHKDRKRRIRQLIQIQKDRFYALEDSEQHKRRSANTPTFVSAVMGAGHHLVTRDCPSCKNVGLLGGSPVGHSAPILKDKGIYREVRIVPEVFECKCCELKIKGIDELMAAGFAHEFRTLDEQDIIEHFGIDPLDYIDTDEIIREYQYQFEIDHDLSDY